jgi:hypothetical protein
MIGAPRGAPFLREHVDLLYRSARVNRRMFVCYNPNKGIEKGA